MLRKATFLAIAILALPAAAFAMYLDNSTVTVPTPIKVPTTTIMRTTTLIVPTATVCTMDAKICPDGSSVGRIGPNCEFAACPISRGAGSSGSGISTPPSSGEAGKPINPIEIKGLNPQPEPPASIDKNKIKNVDEATQLNPQPEPPMPANANGLGKEVGKGINTPTEQSQGKVFEILKSAGQATQLNPQPEPPKPADVQLPAIGNLPAQTLSILPTAQSVQIKFKVNGADVQVDSADNIKVDGSQVKILKGDKEYGLRVAPANFYGALNSVFKKNGFVDNPVSQIKLAVVNDQPVYTMKVKEKAKLFGLIPMNINSDVTVSADTEKVQAVKRPWYAFAASMVNNVGNIKLVPDFALSNFVLDSNTYKKGDLISTHVTLSNDGTADAQTDWSIFGSGTKWLITVGGLQDSMYLTGPLFLAPGQSYTFDFNVRILECAPVQIQFDPGNFLKEENPSNNTVTASGNCTE